MSIPSQKFHEMVFQLLFALDMGDCLEGDLIPFLMRELSTTRKTVREAYHQAQAIFVEREKLDQLIGAASQEYAVERIHRVERNVLRLTLYEMNQDETSRAEIIAEALRLTRKFSTKEATAYVNAILEAVPNLCNIDF